MVLTNYLGHGKNEPAEIWL